MDEYVAIVRLNRPHARNAVASAAESCVAAIRGVVRANFDATAHSLLVWFDRSVVSLADIVRCLEDQGLRVSGVSQSRADAGAAFQTATA